MFFSFLDGSLFADFIFELSNFFIVGLFYIPATFTEVFFLKSTGAEVLVLGTYFVLEYLRAPYPEFIVGVFF
jgi:hypothetical protein